jgi:septal ring factor EnvC (AmiA/AmiB activator)
MTRSKIKITWIAILATCLSVALQAQNAGSQAPANTPSKTASVAPLKGSIDEQFHYVIEKSSHYQDFKVIKENTVNSLMTNVLDTLQKLRTDLRNSNQTIASHQADMKAVKTELQSTNDKLNDTYKEKNSIRLLGILMSKDTYVNTMWIIIALLAVASGIFFLLYKRSNKITLQNRNDLEETKAEFEKFRKRALAREQEMSRNHLAELNKYRKQSV